MAAIVGQQANDVIGTSNGAVGIRTTTPDLSSSLEVNATSKGFKHKCLNLDIKKSLNFIVFEGKFFLKIKQKIFTLV
ncbi:hypothetical protein [Chryseobacterium wanjuense]